MRLLFLLLVLWFSSTETSAQKQRLVFNPYAFEIFINWGKGNIVSHYDAHNHLMYDTSVLENNPSLCDTFTYSQLLRKLPPTKAAYVYYYSQRQHWPAGLVNYFNSHSSKEISLFLNKNAVIYYLTRCNQFEYDAAHRYFKDYTHTKEPAMLPMYLVELPAAENTSLPDSMKPSTDIYLPLRWRPGISEADWAQLGITGKKEIKRATEKLDAIVQATDEKIDTTLYFKTTTPVKDLTAALLLQNHIGYLNYLNTIYDGYQADASAKKYKAIDDLKQGIQSYKNLLIQAIDAYRDNCAFLMKAYNNKEYDKILLFSKWKVGFKFTGNATSASNGPHLYGNADHTLSFEMINNKLRMNSHVVTSGIGEELDTKDKTVGDVFQDFDIWGDFSFAGGQFTPLPGPKRASFTHYTSPPFDLLPNYFLSKKVNGLLEADFTFIVNSSGLYEYPVPLIILNGEKFALKWTYGDEVSAATDLLNEEIEKMKKHIAELEKQ